MIIMLCKQQVCQKKFVPNGDKTKCFEKLAVDFWEITGNIFKTPAHLTIPSLSSFWIFLFERRAWEMLRRLNSHWTGQ